MCNFVYPLRMPKSGIKEIKIVLIKSAYKSVNIISFKSAYKNL